VRTIQAPPLSAKDHEARITNRRINFRRVLRRTLVGSLVFIAVEALGAAIAYRSGHYGFDFHGGIWRAGHDILAGRSPYRAPNAALLAKLGNAYIPPPVLAELLLPLSVLPFGVSITMLNLVCIVSLVAALHLLGVRSREVYAITLCSAPCVFSLVYGDPDAVFVLLAALAWRYRDSQRGAVAVGTLIAAKLLLWPLVIWLAATRRMKNAALAVITAAGLLLASWTAIGFKGLLQYPRFLVADARVQAPNHSVVAALRSAGVASPVATFVALVLAVAVGIVVVRAARFSDRGWFTAALIAGLIASPVVFPNYFLILFVPLAICRGRRVDGVWALTAAFWLFLTPGGWLRGLEWVIAVGIALGAVVAGGALAPDSAPPMPVPARRGRKAAPALTT
jgi:hypothetical protein